MIIFESIHNFKFVINLIITVGDEIINGWNFTFKVMAELMEEKNMVFNSNQ